MQKSIYPCRKIGIEGGCWSKEEARMAFRRDAYKLLKTNIYLQFSDISRIFAFVLRNKDRMIWIRT